MSNILYIGLDYYHYPDAICRSIELAGHKVDFYPIEPKTFFYKATRYLAKSKYRSSLDEYHNSIVLRSKGINYEKVFFITTHFFSDENLSLLKDAHPTAEFIAYHWDSLKQYNFLKTIAYFDQTYSFDKEDCAAHSLQYLPLFACGAYENAKDKNIENDIYTIGSIVQVERYTLVNKFRDYCIKNRIKFYFHLKVTPVTFIRLLFKGIIPKGVSFSTLSNEQMRNVVNTSRVALDVTNHAQSGLTMRVIENIYAGKKVITTNANVKNEIFYDPNQIYIWDSKNDDGLLDFMTTDFNPKSFPMLSVDHWVKKILSL